MKGRLWLLAWISTTFAIETRRLKINLNEEVLIGSEIANLKTELNFGKDRVFSLQTPSDIFQLSTDGILTIKSRVDFETVCAHEREQCNLLLEIGVLPQTSYERVKLEIIINNVNDNLHSFSQPKYELSLSENFPTEKRFDISSLVANDADSNSNLRYHFAADVPFRVEQDGSRLYLINSEELDRESEPSYNTRLIATDGAGQHVETEVVINVQDVNDNAPVFEKINPTVQYSDSSPPGSLVARIAATDLDEGSNAELEYSILSWSPPIAKKFFELEKYSGRLINTFSLVRQQFDEVKLKIIAKDNGMPSLSTEQDITIKIIKSNDYPPEVTLTPVLPDSKSPQAALVIENARIGTFVAWLRVKDPEGDKVEIDIQPEEFFMLDREEMVIIAKKLFDREFISKFELSVTACDAGPSKKCSQASMTVVIGDENDNSPIMEKSEIELNLRENMAVGASLLKVYGRDADSEFGILSFSLDNNGGNFFRIDEKSGEIFLNRQIDFETKSVHQVTAVASDPDGKSATTKIRINVINVNDNVPELNLAKMDSYPVIQIPRNYDLKQPILVINATDRDGTRPILKIDRNDIFMLVKNELYLIQNLTSKFSEVLEITAIDEEDFSSKTTEILYFEIEQTWIPIVAGVCVGVISILVVLILIKLCYEKRYVVYDNEKGHHSGRYQSGRRDGSMMDGSFGDAESIRNSRHEVFRGTISDSEYSKMIVVEKDSGKGDSDSNPDTLTDFCQPECLTLGHSDACWLPANAMNSAKYSIEVGPSVTYKKHSLSVLGSQTVNSTKISDKTSDYSSNNSTNENQSRSSISNGLNQHTDNRTSQIFSCDVIV